MARVVVIGAGIVGASAAQRLSAADVDVVLIDDLATGGATAAGAGIIATVSSKPADVDAEAFRFAAARYYPELVGLCTAAGLSGHAYAPVGQLTLAFDDREADALRVEWERTLDLLRRFGPAGVGTPDLLTGAAIREAFPLVAPMAAGLLLPEVARVDGNAMRDALVELAAGTGAVRLADSARPDIRSDRAVGVRTQHGYFVADAVLIAAGAWTGQLVELRLQPQRGQIVHLRLPGSAGLPTLDTVAGHYLLPFPDDRVVVGATRETGSGFDTATTAGGLAQVLTQGMSLVPTLAAARWIETRVGLRPMSHDGLPYLGAVPGTDSLWIATGMGAGGLTLGPYCGAVIADHIIASLSGAKSVPAIPASYHPGRP